MYSYKLLGVSTDRTSVQPLPKDESRSYEAMSEYTVM